jgi:hypothetical protein
VITAYHCPECFVVPLINENFLISVPTNLLTWILVHGTDVLVLTKEGVLKSGTKGNGISKQLPAFVSRGQGSNSSYARRRTIEKTIAEALQTTAATVGRTIAESLNGSATTIRIRRAAVVTTAQDSDLTKRLKALAVAVVMDGSVDESEKSALRVIIEQRISEAQTRAAQEAIASL